jgi:Ca-activated chloride channel family protein
MTTLRHILPLLVVLAVPCPGRASEPASAYFNDGAARFIKGEREEALAKVKEGLVLYPEDYPLLALKKAIEENQQQEQQQQQQQKEQQQQEQKEQQEKQQQQDDQQRKQNQDQQQQDQEQQEQQQQGGQQDEQQQQREEQDMEPREAREMTREEAAQLLDAFRRQEQAVREQIRVNAGQNVPVEKDW